LVEFDCKRLIIANAGDQRAVLSRASCTVQITTDHKPDEPGEKFRIYNAGGFVNEQKRVNGILALSRSLGDADLQPYVTFEPEVFFVELKEDDRFLILACDGLWDVMSNTKAVEIVDKYRDPVRAAAALRDYAFLLGSTDNISVIVYRLDDAVTWQSLKAKQEVNNTQSMDSSLAEYGPDPDRKMSVELRTIDKGAQDKGVQDILQQNKVPQEKLSQEKVPQDKVPQEKLSQEKVQQNKVPQEKLSQERVPQDKLVQDKVVLQERSSQDTVPQNRVPQEKLSQERVPQDKVPQEKLSQEKVPQDKEAHEKDMVKSDSKRGQTTEVTITENKTQIHV